MRKKNPDHDDKEALGGVRADSERGRMFLSTFTTKIVCFKKLFCMFCSQECHRGSIRGISKCVQKKKPVAESLSAVNVVFFNRLNKHLNMYVVCTCTRINPFSVIPMPPLMAVCTHRSLERVNVLIRFSTSINVGVVVVVAWLCPCHYIITQTDPYSHIAFTEIQARTQDFAQEGATCSRRGHMNQGHMNGTLVSIIIPSKRFVQC